MRLVLGYAGTVAVSLVAVFGVAAMLPTVRLRVDPMVSYHGGKMEITCRVPELQRRVHVWMGIQGAGESQVEYDSVDSAIFRRTYTVQCGNGPAYCDIGDGERAVVAVTVACN